MRASDLAAPFHGVRTPEQPATMKSLCLARATRLPPYAAISHSSAALVDDLPLPQRMRADTTVHVSVPRGFRAPRGRGTRGHQVSHRAEDANQRHGFLCTTPARTFCDLAPDLSLGELVAVGDHILRTGLATPTEIRGVVDAHGAARGRRRLLAALPLLNGRAESPKESEARVLLIEMKRPAPVPQHEVRDAAGRFVARVDLAYPKRRIAMEYEGDHHRERGQWQRDLARRRRLEALGWTYLTITQTDLDDPRAFLADLDAALAR